MRFAISDPQPRLSPSALPGPAPAFFTYSDLPNCIRRSEAGFAAGPAADSRPDPVLACPPH